MKTAEFDYRLPPELIAQTPIEPRDASRLMVIDRRARTIGHRRFYDLPEYLRAGDLLVYNESRVIPARLFARKPTGGQVEILLLRRRSGEMWEALVGGRHVRVGTRLTLLNGPDGQPAGGEAEVVEAGERDSRVLAFDRPVLALADQIGVTPLPPYIHTPLADVNRYQTVYARTPGSAAAPTAGLHFTPELLQQLETMEVRSAFVTLHIGLDTFRPVSEEHLEEHRMHTEYATLSPEAAARVNQARIEGSRIIAVGTTSVRVLESASLQVGKSADPKPQIPNRKSQIGNHASPIVQPFEGPTDLFIYPGYEFRTVDALITNFHLPRSTLLMLVAAFIGKDLLDYAYAEAVRERYRFYSFGDAMVIV